MAEFDGEEKINGVFGGVCFEENEPTNIEDNLQVKAEGLGFEDNNVFKKVEANALPTKPSVWSKIRSFLFQEIDLFAPIKVELTPHQQKIEDEINEFLHQEISIKGFIDLLRK